jgi:magnesium-transporting ATPase (P-type)
VSYEERNAWAGLVVGAGALMAYVIVLLTSADGGPVSAVAYQPIMLWTIGIAIVLMIIATIGVSIVTGIVTGDTDFRSDQRDKEIGRFAERMGRAFLVIGALAAMLMAMAQWDFFWIANTLFAAFAVSGVVEGAAKVMAYRRGLPQW